MAITTLLLRQSLLCFFLGWGSILNTSEAPTPPQVKQLPEVVEAYHVCEKFERLLGANLDFERAYEATFTKNMARRRAIAIADGEFGDLDFASIDDAELIKAYKLRMQIFYLMLPLAGPSDEEAAVFFPPEIKQILQREAPRDVRQFSSYVSQLARDVDHFRSHLDRLAAQNSSVAERVHKFKSETPSVRLEPPTNYKVAARHGYFRDGVLGQDEAYYEINGYSVIKDEGQMRIIGIRFFTRLF